MKNALAALKRALAQAVPAAQSIPIGKPAAALDALPCSVALRVDLRGDN